MVNHIFMYGLVFPLIFICCFAEEDFAVKETPAEKSKEKKAIKRIRKVQKLPQLPNDSRPGKILLFSNKLCLGPLFNSVQLSFLLFKLGVTP